MTSFGKGVQEIEDKKNSNKNLKMSIISVGLLIVASITFFLGIDSFYPGHSQIITLTLIVLFYLLMVVAAIVATLTLKKSLDTLKTSKNSKNYIAIGISILVLLIIDYEILQRL